MKPLPYALAVTALLRCGSSPPNMPTDGGRDVQDLGSLVGDASKGNLRQCGYNLNRFPEGFVDEEKRFTAYMVVPDDGVSSKNLGATDFAVLLETNHGVIFPPAPLKLASKVPKPENENTIYFSIGCDSYADRYFGETLDSCDDALKKYPAFVATRSWSPTTTGIVVVGSDAQQIRGASEILVRIYGQKFPGYAAADNGPKPEDIRRIDNCSN